MFSDADVAALIQAAGRLRPGPRRATYQALIGLPAVTGMRAGEACRLGRGDVDLNEETVTIVDSKFGKSRELVLHSTTTVALVDICLAP